MCRHYRKGQRSYFVHYGLLTFLIPLLKWRNTLRDPATVVSFLTTTVELSNGPGFVIELEAYKLHLPLMSTCSIRTVRENAVHSVWKNRNPSSGTSVVVFSPGSTIAGAMDKGG